MPQSKILRSVEQAMERALRPGAFITDQACFSFVRQLDRVAAQLATLLEQGEAAHAVTLYELFLAACHEKAEEIDDSSGQLGQFVEELYCGWITAREAAGADPAETASTLLNWMEEDPYGFCYHLERRAVNVFTPHGLAVFEQAVRKRVEAGADRTSPAPARRDAAYAQWRGVEILKTIYAAQGNIEAYHDVCARGELTPAECEVIAALYQQRDAPEEALAWVDRGLALEAEHQWGMKASVRLPDMRRDVLRKLGRAEEALASAWEEFRAHPFTWTYTTLMRFVPAAERERWHTKAMATTDAGDLDAVLPLWLETKEVDRLLVRLRRTDVRELEALSHHATEPVAKYLAPSHPDLAARLHRALGLRILTAKKSKYYDAAIAHFAQAKDCYARAGREEEWQALVTTVRRAHGRKYGFMPGFEQVVEGRSPQSKESFLARAQRRWSRHGHD